MKIRQRQNQYNSCSNLSYLNKVVNRTSLVSGHSTDVNHWSPVQEITCSSEMVSVRLRRIVVMSQVVTRQNLSIMHVHHYYSGIYSLGMGGINVEKAETNILLYYV